jgi:ABC-type multidrug transport system ATPase subunit
VHLQLAGITKRYGSTPALENFTVEIPAGNIVALIGLNGAGKTTLLRCLSGIVAPDRGVISYDRQKFHRDRIDLRRRLMFLPDFPAIYADMNVLQHVSLMLRIYERDFAPAEEVIMQTLAELDLLPLAEAPVAQMSRGQLYKVALSALVAVAPDLWLLDEPFASGLDPQGIAFFKNESRAHAARGGTVLYSTQILEIAEKFCDRLLVIDHGGLAANYTRQDLISFPAEGPESLESRLRQFREIST